MTRMARLVGLIIILTASFYASAADQLYLQPDDVQKVMDKMLHQHVKNKEITTEILRTSFKVYIDQFDPDRVYLLESEVIPFYNMNDTQINRILNQYKSNNFSIYQELNRTIQQAIVRAQEYRNAWVGRQDAYLDDIAGSQWKAKKEDEINRSVIRFSRNLSELRERQKQEITRFVRGEINRYGEGVLGSKQKSLVVVYDKKMKEREAQYLYVSPASQELTGQEKDNLITMHIIKALAKSLDAHTAFYNSNEAYDMRVRLEKGFDGLGIILQKNSEGYKVVRLMENSPAAMNGSVQKGDYVEKINGKSLNELSLEEVMRLLRGKSGTLASLQIKRLDESVGQEKTLNIVLMRAPIVINEGRVEASYIEFADGIIGTIKLHSFYQGSNGISSVEDVERAIKDLSKKGVLKGLVLDLRDNSGGFLTQAVKVAGLFITNGVIVVSKYANGEEKYYRDMDGKVSYKGPLIVLTSRATASAAEIVAQALQDYGVALIVGDKQTYGKGTIQSQTVTGDGSSYFKVTVGKYYTVSGKTPQIQGVKADIVVPSPYSLEQIGEEYLEYPIGQDTIAPSFDDRLKDIDPGLKPWYLRYYMPTLQRESREWRTFLPFLQKNSTVRLAHNSRYKEYLDKGRYDEEHSYGFNPLLFYADGDPQHREALNIVKDMIILDAEKKRTQKLGITDNLLMGEND